MTRYLHDHLTVGGFLGFLFLFVPVWRTWMGYTYYADLFDVDGPAYRVAMLLSIALAVSIHGAPGRRVERLRRRLRGAADAAGRPVRLGLAPREGGSSAVCAIRRRLLRGRPRLGRLAARAGAGPLRAVGTRDRRGRDRHPVLRAAHRARRAALSGFAPAGAPRAIHDHRARGVYSRAALPPPLPKSAFAARLVVCGAARQSPRCDRSATVGENGIIAVAAADELTVTHPGEHGTAMFLAGHASFKWAVFGALSWPSVVTIVVLMAATVSNRAPGL
jgi:hypothetical protein